jgi:hypothetical protein
MLHLTIIIFVKDFLKFVFYSSQRMAVKGVLSASPAYDVHAWNEIYQTPPKMCPCLIK